MFLDQEKLQFAHLMGPNKRLNKPVNGNLAPTRLYYIRLSVTIPPAGMCWLQSQDQRCDMVLMRGVTREECCAGGRLDTAWSNTSMPMNEVSLLGFLGIVSCKPCKGNPMKDEPVRSASTRSRFWFVLRDLKVE